MLSELVVEEFFLLLLRGPHPSQCRPTHVLALTFVATFVAVLEHVMENAPEFCKSRAATLRKGFQHAQQQMQESLHYLYTAFAGHQNQVREELLEAMIDGLDVAMHALDVVAAKLWRSYLDTTPPPGFGDSVEVTALTRLKALGNEESTNRLLARAKTWEPASEKGAGAGGVTRKPAAGASEAKAPTLPGTVRKGAGPESTFRARMQHKQNPPGGCAYV